MTTENVLLDSVVAQQLRAEAQRQGISVDAALADALERYLASPRRDCAPSANPTAAQPSASPTSTTPASTAQDEPTHHAAAVTMQPMMHVADMAGVLAVLDLLGATVTQGSASGDWAKVRLAGADLGLLAHPPNRAQGDESVELTFEAHTPLEQLETAAREGGIAVDTPITEFGFGRQLVLRAGDGTRFKVNQLRSHIE